MVAFQQIRYGNLSIVINKNGKSSGPDGISNEMLKISPQFFIEEFVVLFNFILKSGVTQMLSEII